MRKLPQKIRNIIIAVLVVVAAVSYIYENFIRKPEKVEGEIVVYTLDVGQGDSTLIRTPSGNLLIDAGPNASETQLLAYLEEVGVESLDYLILTHPHEDHIGGADVVIENLQVENVIMTAFESASRTYEDLLFALEESTETDVIECLSGAEYSLGEMKIKLLGPDPGDVGEDANNSSIITKITYGEVSLMFTGDAEAEREAALIYRWGRELDCDFMKLGHHGSVTSNSGPFLDAVSPNIAVISCGEDNTYGHPHREILAELNERKIEYYRTDKEGTLIFVCDGKRIVRK